MARNKIAKKTVSVADQAVSFLFSDNEKVTARLSEVPEVLLTRLALHGLAQKLGDAYAGCDNATDGRVELNDVYKELKAGNWSMRAESAGPRVTVLARAMVVIKGCTIDYAVARLSDMSPDNRKALRADPSVAAQCAIIESEDARERAKKLKAAAKEVGGTTSVGVSEF